MPLTKREFFLVSSLSKLYSVGLDLGGRVNFELDTCFGVPLGKQCSESQLLSLCSQDSEQCLSCGKFWPFIFIFKRGCHHLNLGDKIHLCCTWAAGTATPENLSSEMPAGKHKKEGENGLPVFFKKAQVGFYKFIAMSFSFFYKAVIMVFRVM